MGSCQLHLADIAVEYDYGWAAAYDLVIRRKGEQDPTFGAAEALPLYIEMNMDVVLNLKMKLSPPAHRTSSSSGPRQQPAGTDYPEQQPGQGRKRVRPKKSNKVKTAEWGQERLKSFPSLLAWQYPAIMPPPPPVESGANNKDKGAKGGDRAKGKGKGKGKGSPWC